MHCLHLGTLCWYTAIMMHKSSCPPRVEEAVHLDAIVVVNRDKIYGKEIAYMSLSRQMERSYHISDNSLESQYWTYLMCPPDHFRIGYEINPWMNRAIQPDPIPARNQWD